MDTKTNLTLDVEFENPNRQRGRKMGTVLAAVLFPEVFRANRELREALAEAKSVLDANVARPATEIAEETKQRRISELKAELARLESQ